nr:hypothetical protein [Tanacetum cinerariifolium]
MQKMLWIISKGVVDVVDNFKSLVRDVTIASSLEAEQNSGNIDKTQSKVIPNEASSPGTTSDGGPRCQEAMGDTIAQTSDEDIMKLNELMELCTNLQTKLLDLEKTKTTQALEIDSLKRRVKKLENKQRSRTHKLKRLYKVGLSARVDSSDDNEDLGEDASKQGRKIHDIDADEDITLVTDEIQKLVEEEGEDINTAKLIGDAPQVNAAGEVTAASIATTYKFPLPVKVVPTARRLEMPLPEVCTAIEEMMKKLPVKDR